MGQERSEEVALPAGAEEESSPELLSEEESPLSVASADSLSSSLPEEGDDAESVVSYHSPPVLVSGVLKSSMDSLLP